MNLNVIIGFVFFAFRMISSTTYNEFVWVVIIVPFILNYNNGAPSLWLCVQLLWDIFEMFQFLQHAIEEICFYNLLLIFKTIINLVVNIFFEFLLVNRLCNVPCNILIFHFFYFLPFQSFLEDFSSYFVKKLVPIEELLKILFRSSIKTFYRPRSSPLR